MAVFTYLFIILILLTGILFALRELAPNMYALVRLDLLDRFFLFLEGGKRGDFSLHEKKGIEQQKLAKKDKH